jgi:TPR repeat protein
VNFSLHFIQSRRTPFLLVLLAAALISALAQAPATQPSPVDPALLAKANAGDATAQVQVGDAYAAGKGVPREPRLPTTSRQPSGTARQPTRATLWPRFTLPTFTATGEAWHATWRRP